MSGSWNCLSPGTSSCGRSLSPLQKLREFTRRKRCGRSKRGRVHFVNDHRFKATSLIQPTFCSHCKGFIWGFVRQGYRCKLCFMVVHKRCNGLVLTRCTGAISRDQAGQRCDSEGPDEGYLGAAYSADSVGGSGFGINVHHTFRKQYFTKPSCCDHCGTLMYGVIGAQGVQCLHEKCQVKAHFKCTENVPNHCCVNHKQLAESLQSLGTTGDRLEQDARIRAKHGLTWSPVRAPRFKGSSSYAALTPNRSDTPQSRCPSPSTSRCQTAPPGASALQESSHNANVDRQQESPHSETSQLVMAFSALTLGCVGCRRRSSSSEGEAGSRAARSERLNESLEGTKSGYRKVATTDETTVTDALPRQAPLIGSARASAVSPDTPLVTGAPRPRAGGYKLNDFEFIKVLSKGALGSVMLAELHEGSNCLVAVKIQNKDNILVDDETGRAMTERRVLALTGGHPFLAHLMCSFQTPERLFFVMEYVPGGDLFSHLHATGRFDESRAKFYAAEVTLALVFLHAQGIIHRDLKLEHVMLDIQGHCKLVDFGLCKEGILNGATTTTLCGTPECISPEVLLNLKYGPSVDWWALGVFLYEMVVGRSPFVGTNEYQLYRHILTEQVRYPHWLTHHVVSILRGLFAKDPGQRLGCVSSCGGEQAILEHKFFKNIEWKELESKNAKPPFIPKVLHSRDVSNFDAEIVRQEPVLCSVDEDIISIVNQDDYKGFSYTNENFFC